MSKKGLFWLCIIGLLVLSAYLVPYLLLSQVDTWYGSLLFWSLFALATIVANVLIAAGWRDEG